jgi:hypothetical protein
LWAKNLEPEPSSVSAVFHYLRGKDDKKACVFAPSWNEIGAEWANALSDWLSVAKSGTFPPFPHHRFTYAGKTPTRYCDSCSFKDHCRVSNSYDGSETEGALTAAVSQDPALGILSFHRPPKG